MTHRGSSKPPLSHNGMTETEQPEIALLTQHFAVAVTLPAHVQPPADLRERMADAVHGCFPVCEDGDTVVVEERAG